MMENTDPFGRARYMIPGEQVRLYPPSFDGSKRTLFFYPFKYRASNTDIILNRKWTKGAYSDNEPI